MTHHVVPPVAPRAGDPAPVALASPGTASPRAASRGWTKRLLRPSLLTLTAGAAAASTIAHAVAGTNATEAVSDNRFGNAIAQSISERDQSIARRTRAAELREQSALALEQRVQAQLGARRDGGARDDRGGYGDAPQPIEDLARVYQTMKPNRAAPVFAALDIDLQAQVARRMRGRSLALMMGAMTPAAALRLSTALAGRAAPEMIVAQQRVASAAGVALSPAPPHPPSPRPAAAGAPPARTRGEPPRPAVGAPRVSAPRIAASPAAPGEVAATPARSASAPERPTT
ncbi:magnesium transporter [Sphingomonas sp. RHCKR7]|uniref:MotE family protein n=1 Tax=Sphingomonas folli TaxID=2862497 RepID=UPI001CA4E640|nr:magnesium transporter [Sphingomonas folli]MBW6525565.1 magnesium transporter [Sphingomonas folli]